jgi:uncharacterized membrane protein YhiD involved in acid resistance
MDALTISRLTGITQIDISLEEIALRLLAAFILSTITAIVYRTTHKSYSFSYNMIVSIILVAIIVSMVLMVIDHSLARAFGLVGALAIIRFRTPVKDIRDIVFLFASVAVGISSGAGAYEIAVFGTVAVNSVAFLLYKARFGEVVKGDSLLLKIYVDEGAITEESYVEILNKYCDSYALVEMFKGQDIPQEIIFSIKLIGDDKLEPLSDELLKSPSVSRISVLSAMHHMDLQ